ncbi:isoprenylcysteine carboxylmethyltransferase family protein [Enterovibrio norvegicus]|uniref:methyltransferase family protein n=1 Tax=Enterovibrio norvegicus TaxID=188144 RepID=UPI003D0CBC72
MDSLKLKIPPLVLVVITLVVMKAIATFLPTNATLANLPLLLPILLVGVGGAVMVAGVYEFRRKQTTVNPMLKTASSALVSDGVYRFTRNPMYLGMLCILVAAALLWNSAYALLGCAFFVFYMNAFQISPEEDYLTELFPDSYPEYKTRVRRWL